MAEQGKVTAVSSIKIPSLTWVAAVRFGNPKGHQHLHGFRCRRRHRLHGLSADLPSDVFNLGNGVGFTVKEVVDVARSIHRFHWFHRFHRVVRRLRRERIVLG